MPSFSIIRARDISSGEFLSAIAKMVEEARILKEAGFEYVADVDGLKIFRRRK
jgi:hypothetical protein